VLLDFGYAREKVVKFFCEPGITGARSRRPLGRRHPELLDAALAVAPTETAPDRRRRFRVIEGGRA
jgi:hypothetical protein